MKWSLMGFIQNNHMILKQVRIVDTLANKNTICNVPQGSLFTGFIVKPDCVSDLPSNLAWSFIRDSGCHTYSSHSAGLSDDYIDFLYWFESSIRIFFNIILIFNNGLTDKFGVHHVLRQLRRLTWTCISSDYAEVVLCD